MFNDIKICFALMFGFVASIGSMPAYAQYNVYSANLHVHTNASDSDHYLARTPLGTVDKSKAVGLDAIGLSDHAGAIDSSEWSYQSWVSDETTRYPSSYVVGIRGFEWTYCGIALNTATYDHINIFGTSQYWEANSSNPLVSELSSTYQRLASAYVSDRVFDGRPPVAQFNHIWMGTHFNNFAYNQQADQIINLIELGGTEVYHSIISSETWYQEALQKGWHVGPTIGADNTTVLDSSAKNHHTGVWASSCTRGNIMDALSARRVFATEHNDFKLKFQAATETEGVWHWLGDTLSIGSGDGVDFSIVAEDPGNDDPASYATVVSVFGSEHSAHYDGGNQFTLHLTWDQLQQISMNALGEWCFYVRIRHISGACSFSAPVWLKPYTRTLGSITYNPDAGSFSDEQNVTVNCSTPGAIIHYTTNGSDPTESDPIIASGSSIYIDRNLTLKARAFKPGWTPSGVKSASYQLVVKTPSFSPEGGSFYEEQNVAITCPTAGAVIHYTTNGNDPTEADPVVASGAIFYADRNLTLKARAYRSGWNASGIKTAVFTFTVKTPTLGLKGGFYETPQDNLLECPTSNAIIHFTKNGDDPIENSESVLSGQIVRLNKTCTFKIKAYRDGWNASEIVSDIYHFPIRVKNGTSAGIIDGTSWDCAYNTISDAINAAIPGDKIWVASGRYQERIAVPDSIQLFGGFCGTEVLSAQRDRIANVTIIDGNNEGTVVSFASDVSSNTILDGFTICNGYGHVAGINSPGLHSAPIISNNTISNNKIPSSQYGSSGVVMDCRGNPTIISNNISKNFGGIIKCQGSPTISENQITDNDIGYYNSVVFVDQGMSGNNVVLSRNTIKDNRDLGWGYVTFDGWFNLVVSQNTISRDGTGPAVYSYDGYTTVAITYNTVQGGIYFASVGGTISDNVISDGNYGGIRCRGIDLKIHNNTIDGNKNFGIFSEDSCRLEITDNVVKECINGTGIFLSDSSKETIVSRNLIMGNENNSGTKVVAGRGGGICAGGSAYISNNIIVGNQAMFGGGVYIPFWTDGVKLINNTFIANEADEGGALFCSWSSAYSQDVDVENNIFAHGSSGVAFYDEFGASAVQSLESLWDISQSTNFSTATNDLLLGPIFKNNCVYGNRDYDSSGLHYLLQESNNICDDPRIPLWSCGNFQLASDSPCRDAGSDSAAILDSIDKNLKPRVNGMRVDIGALEYDGSAIPENPLIVRVRTDGNDANDGSTWGLAKRTISAGINAIATNGGGEVWVQGGTYYEQDPIRVPRYVHLLGGFIGNEDARNQRDYVNNETVIDGEEIETTMWGLVEFDRPGYLLNSIDGFTLIVKNNSYGYSLPTSIYSSWCSPLIANNKIYNDYVYWRCSGIQLHSSYATVRNNQVTGCCGFEYAGIDAKYGRPLIEFNILEYNDCPAISNRDAPYEKLNSRYSEPIKSALIYNNKIRCNSGFGILSYRASPVIASNVISGCTAGIYCDYFGMPSIINNTVVGNSREGINIRTFIPTNVVSNNIVAYNQSGISIPYFDGNIVNNCVYGNTASDFPIQTLLNGNLSVDPQFIDFNQGNYHLSPLSPCVDTGRDEYIGQNWKDMDGTNRIMGPHVDVGADEYNPESIVLIPTGGKYYNELQVQVICGMPEVTLHYTTNGNDPTETDPVIDPGSCISVSRSLNLRVKAYNSNNSSSLSVSADYTLQAATPSLSIPGGTYAEPKTVAIDSPSSGTHVHYTMDGSIPNDMSPVYSGPILLSNSTVIKAFASKDGWMSSDIISGEYLFRVASPEYSIPGGVYESPQKVWMSCSTPGANIHYTVDGSEPTEESLLVSGPIEINRSLCLTAKAFLNGWVSSDCSIVHYLFKVAEPRFSPESGEYDSTQSVTVTCSTPGSHIHFTTDYSEPNEDSPVVSGPILVDGNTYIAAKAFRDGLDPSDTGFAWYTVYDTIEKAKNKEDGQETSIRSSIVTAAFPDYFYLESDNRSCAIAVHYPGHWFSTGMRCTIWGILATAANGERFIESNYAYQDWSNPTGKVAPLGINGKWLGGGDAVSFAGTQIRQKGVSNSIGLNNIGLLIKTWGKVTSIDSECSVIGYWDLDTDPGWSRSGEWEYGVPNGAGGSIYSYNDPLAGYTGSNVFGVNLNGNYSTLQGGPWYLTAGPFDCSGKRGLSLAFQRWLNIQWQSSAYATVEASTNGLQWSPVWSNGYNQVLDSSWVSCIYDISRIADDQPTVYLRWGYQIGQWADAYSGWNIDDITLTSNVCRFTLDDGSGVKVTVVVPQGVILPDKDAQVYVTGVSSCYREGGTITRLVRVRSQEDIVVVQ